MDTETVKLLVVNTGATPITTEKHEILATEKQKIHDTILDSLNKFGKMAHVLAKFGGKLYILDHTARKGPSKEYFKHEVSYHPMSGELS